MIKIAICDDDIQVLEKMVSIVKDYFRIIDRTVWVAEYKSGARLLKANARFDIIFLDIEMPQMDGIETAQKLRNWDLNSKIIYVTNYSQYQKRAYKVHAFDYIDKPLQEKAIFGVLKEAIRYLDGAIKKQKYAFDTEEGIITLELDDIYYFEYLTKKVIINSAKGKYVSRYSLKELYEKIGNNSFELPHKSFIVNFLHIKGIKGFEIFMENGATIPLAQKRAVKFKEKFNDFLQSTFEKV